MIQILLFDQLIYFQNVVPYYINIIMAQIAQIFLQQILTSLSMHLSSASSIRHCRDLLPTRAHSLLTSLKRIFAGKHYTQVSDQDRITNPTTGQSNIKLVYIVIHTPCIQLTEAYTFHNWCRREKLCLLTDLRCASNHKLTRSRYCNA